MKRLNPATGEPFKRGDVREDGKRFWKYNGQTSSKPPHYFTEKWVLDATFGKIKQKIKEKAKKRKYTMSQKALEQRRNASKYGVHANGMTRALPEGTVRHGPERTMFGAASQLMNNARERARMRGGSFDLTLEWFKNQIDSSNSCCPVSGLPYDFGAPASTRTKNPRGPSLDRIDSLNSNYTQDNVRVVSYAVNVLCGTWGLEEAIKIAKAIAERN